MKSESLSCLLHWLYSTQLFGIKLGLEGVSNLLQLAGAELGAARVVHVAGTNGKGSSSAMMESIARAYGLRTGLFTSPHLVDFRERIRINGELVGEELVINHLTVLRGLAESMATPPTFFELVFCLALLCFKDSNVDIIILETGMGGRLDATNAVPKSLAVLVPIGLDHQQYLGNTLEKIASEKAAIIQEGTPVVSAQQVPEVRAVIEAFAEERRAPLAFVEKIHPLASYCALAGHHQQENASLALTSMEILGLNDPEKCKIGLETVRWSGRFERRQERLILDGAHNPHAVRVLVDTWKTEMKGEKACLIFAASADKQLEEMILMLEDIAGEWILVPVDSPRILPPLQMQQYIARLSCKPYRIAESLSDALLWARESDQTALVSGSLFLIGELSALLDGAEHHSTAQ